jgi:cytochrome c-type biogenesis protein CcmH/NrfF
MAQHRQTTALVLTGAISILIGFVPGYLTGLKYGLNSNRAHAAGVSSYQPLPANASNPTLAVNVEEIIKELNCVCGCKMELAPCTCDERRGAQEIRRSVQTLVQQGVSRPEIIKGLMEKYGEAILIKRT